jgi:hypothetical protein
MTARALLSTLASAEAAARELLDARVSLHDAAWIVKTALIAEALRRTHGNKCRAARMLGIHRNLLDYQIRELALVPLVDQVRQSAAAQLELFLKKPAGSVPAPAKARRAA